MKTFLRFLIATVLFAAAAPLRASESSVRLAPVAHGDYRLTGRFETTAPAAVAREVLTDYDHIGEFVSSVKSSRLLRREADRALVDQSSEGRLLFFTRQVTLCLDVRESPSQIAFRDTLQRDFLIYEGTWTLVPTASGLEVAYELRAKPRFSVPEFLMKNRFRKTVQSLLDEVRREIERRQAARP